MSPLSPYILLAEDDPDDQETFRRDFLKRRPEAEVICVDSGEQMIAFLTDCNESQLPALILMDFSLPLRTADSFLKQLSTESRYTPIPKLVWSTSNRHEFVDRCIEAGALRYFSKPATLSELDEILNVISETFDRKACSAL